MEIRNAAEQAKRTLDARLRSHDVQLADLEVAVESLRSVNVYTTDGSRTLNGPLAHAGPTVGFFGVAPQRQSGSLGSLDPATVTAASVAKFANELHAVLQSYGLVGH